jgi:hypothetical membrane protein
MVAGPLFVAASVVQGLTRPGFDLRRHAISTLSLGDLGWIQVSNFLVTGLLVLACAVGIRRVLHPGRAGTWGPLLFGGYGAGLVAAGIFHPDPALGFPLGTPDSMPATMSWHAGLHTLAFLVAVASLMAAAFVFARRFSVLGQRGWAAYCAVTGVAPVLLIALSTALGGSGLPLLGVAVVASAFVAALPARLVATETSARARARGR